MKNRMKNKLCILMAGCVLTLMLMGCSVSNKRHDQNKALAKQRWIETRAGHMYALAKQQFLTGDLDKSEKTILEALHAEANTPGFYDLAARISIERGALEVAFIKLNKSIELNAKRYESHYLMGLVLQRWQRYEQALKEYDLSFVYDADNVTGLLASVEMLVKLNRIEEATQRLRDKVVYFANNAPLRVALGRIKRLEGNIKESIHWFQEAALLAPGNPMIYEFLAKAQYETGAYDDAAYYFAKALEHETYAKRQDIRIILANSYIHLHRPLDARKSLIEVIEKDPGEIDAWVKLAQVCLSLRDRTRLNESVRQILSLAPNRYEGYMMRGMIELQNENQAVALSQFEYASQLAPQNIQVRIMLGMTLEQLGQSHKAATVYKQAIKLDPGDDRARQLLAHMSL